MRKSPEFFVCQQGFPVPNDNPHLYAALMLQPRIVGGLAVLGLILQRYELYLALSAALGWAALIPTQNVFDAIYNRAIAVPRGLPPLRVAPAPRRFAQACAALLALAVGLSLAADAIAPALILEAVFLVGAASAVLRRFCLPAHLYHVLRRRLTPASSLAGSPQGC
jgi:hypothetical protein